MADQNIEIKVTTVAEGDGAKKTADELGKVDQAAKATAKSQEKMGREAERAAAGKASKFKAVGDAIKNFLGGSADSAIASLQQLGPKIAAGGAVAMASVGAFKAVSAAIERLRTAATEAKKAEIDILVKNAAEAAEQGALSFAAMGRAIAAAADKREGLAAIAKEAADLADQLERQNIANNRAKELSGATDEIERAKINRKYDEQLAGLDSRARDRGVSSEAERIERERQRLAEENDLLRKGIQDDRRNVGRLSQAAQMAGEEGDAQLPRWATPLVDIGGWDTKKMERAKAYYDQQGELTGKAQETLVGMREKAERIKANEQAMQLLEERKKAVVPAMRQLNAATDMGAIISSASAGTAIARSERKRAAEKAAAEKKEEEAAQELAKAQYQRSSLLGRRAELQKEIAPAQAEADAASRAAAEAANRLAATGAKWAGSDNKRWRDQEMEPLKEQAESAASAAAGAERTLQRTINSTEKAVREIDATLKQLDAQIEKLGSRMAAGRGDQPT